jgi:SnoaL-like domain
MTTDRKTLALAYLEAVAAQDYGKLEQLFAPDLQFHGPAMSRSTAAEFIAALKRLAAIHVRNDVKRVFVDGDELCVIYDFVTDTCRLAPDHRMAEVRRRPDPVDRSLL